MKSSAVVALVFGIFLVSCGGGSTPSAPSPTAGPPGQTGPPANPAGCSTVGGRTVTLGRTSAVGAFTHAPFNATDLALITNGRETNDPRFSYQWIRNQGSSINVYAPTDGVLIRLRHKTPNAMFASDDFDMIFLAACDPARPVERDTMFRFNHITDPRADIRAAYAAGDLPAPDLSVTPVVDHEDRQVPLVNIRVTAGELLGTTRGTPVARNFDFAISIDNQTVCPFSALNDPHRTSLLALLGPQRASPFGPPSPGYACEGYGNPPCRPFPSRPVDTTRFDPGSGGRAW